MNLGPQDSTTIIAEEVTMRFIHADQTEEDAEEEDEMMSKIRRQIDYMQFFQGKERFFIPIFKGYVFRFQRENRNTRWRYNAANWR